MKIQDIFIAHPQTKEQVSALKAFMEALKIKFEISKEVPYDNEFVKNAFEGRKNIKDGRFTDVKPEKLEEFIDSL